MTAVPSEDDGKKPAPVTQLFAGTNAKLLKQNRLMEAMRFVEEHKDCCLAGLGPDEAIMRVAEQFRLDLVELITFTDAYKADHPEELR